MTSAENHAYWKAIQETKRLESRPKNGRTTRSISVNIGQKGARNRKFKHKNTN